MDEALETPDGRADDVLDRAVRAVVGDVEFDRVRAQLDRYGTEPHEREVLRVRLAIVKLMSEDGADRLDYLVDVAKRDFRDVLAWAEYPAQFRAPFKLPEDEAHGLMDADKQQYDEWLKRFT